MNDKSRCDESKDADGAERDETPRARPSASPCMMRPKVRGYAFARLGFISTKEAEASACIKPPLEGGSGCSRSPISASNSTVEFDCCPTVWRATEPEFVLVCECECECGATSCSITSIKMKPKISDNAICAVGSLSEACASVSMPSGMMTPSAVPINMPERRVRPH